MGENAEIITFAITVVTFIVLLVNETRYHRKDTHRFDDVDRNTDRLSSEHAEMQRQIKEQVKDAEGLLKEQMRNTEYSLSGKLASVAGETGKIKDDLTRFIAREEGVKEKVAEILPKEDRILYEVRVLYGRLAALAGDNDSLRKELGRSEAMRERLEEELSWCREENAALREQIDEALAQEHGDAPDPGHDDGPGL